MSSHFLQHLFAEDLGWRFPSKALARRIVEAITDHLHIVICALPDIAFAGQPPSKASVSVLDCAFLPGAGGVAEPRLGSDLGLQVRPTDKLGSAVKSDGPTGDEGRSLMALMILAMTGLVRLFGFFRITVKRLTRSTNEVTLDWPSFCLNSIKSASQ